MESATLRFAPEEGGLAMRSVGVIVISVLVWLGSRGGGLKHELKEDLEGSIGLLGG